MLDHQAREIGEELFCYADYEVNQFNLESYGKRVFFMPNANHGGTSFRQWQSIPS